MIVSLLQLWSSPKYTHHWSLKTSGVCAESSSPSTSTRDPVRGQDPQRAAARVAPDLRRVALVQPGADTNGR